VQGAMLDYKIYQHSQLDPFAKQANRSDPDIGGTTCGRSKAGRP
jgi:hypothetical protein